MDDLVFIFFKFFFPRSGGATPGYLMKIIINSAQINADGKESLATLT
jgi:hypothetical protein